MAARIGSWTTIQSSADPLSQNVTVPSGAQLAVLCVALYDTGAPAPDAVTLGGAAMTLSNRVTVDVAEQTGIWYLVNPTIGASVNLTFNHNGAIDEGAHFFISFWNGVDTGAPVTSLGSNQNGSNNVTVSTTSVTANTGDVAVGVGCVFGTDGIALNGEVVDDTVFNGNDAAVAEIAGSGAAVQFTVTTGDFPAVSGIIIRNSATSDTPITVDPAGSVVGASENVVLVFSEAFVIAVNHGAVAGESQQIPFILTNPGTGASVVGASQNVTLLFNDSYVITVDQTAFVGAGQNVTLLAGANVVLTVDFASAVAAMQDVGLAIPFSTSGGDLIRRARRRGFFRRQN